jgi:hypothetical protein
MSSLAHVDDGPRGEFDPTSDAEVERLVCAATRFFGETLALLPSTTRREILDEVRFGAIEAALAYDAATAKTTKWKTAANRANTIVRRRLRELPREALTETDVFTEIRREHPGVTPDLTLVMANTGDDDDRWELSPEEERMLDEADTEEEALRREFGGEEDDPDAPIDDPTEADRDPLLRADDEDAEHFEMRRLLMNESAEPDRTILRRWTHSAPEIAALVDLSPDAVRQRKTRLRRRIEAELSPPAPQPKPGP